VALQLPPPPATMAKANADRFLLEHAGTTTTTATATTTSSSSSSSSSSTGGTKGKRTASPTEAGAMKKVKVEEEAVSAEKGSAVVEQPPEEVAGFVRTLFTLLRVCDPSVVSWSEDGTAMLIHDPSRFAGEICPKFFRHRNFNSFTRLLNMYQFHKVPGNGRDKAVTFVHPSFRRGRDDLLSKIQRKGSSSADKGQKQAESDEAKKKKLAEAERKKADKAVKKAQPPPSLEKPRRAPSIFPSAAHYRAAAGTPEALIGRDVWERTNAEITELEKRQGFLSQSTVGGSSAVSTWMRRVVELEREARALKAENDRLKTVQNEVDQLRAQVQAQNDLITQIQFLDSTLTTPTDDDPLALWRSVLAHQHHQPAAAAAATSSLDDDANAALFDALPADTQGALKNIAHAFGDAATAADALDQPGLANVLAKAFANPVPTPAAHHGAAAPDDPPAFDIGDMQQFMQQQQPPSSAAPPPAAPSDVVDAAGVPPKLDMATLVNEPFTAQCLAQCLAMTGSIPTPPSSTAP